MSRNDAEFRLTCAVADHLRLQAPVDCYWTHIANGEARSAITGARLKRMGVRRGNPDFLFIRNGHAYGLELKVGKNRASPYQVKAGNDWSKAYGTYRVATGIDEALFVLKLWGLLPETYSFEPASRRQLSLMEAG